MMGVKHNPIAIADEKLDQTIGGGGTFGDVVVVKELGGQGQLPNVVRKDYYFDGSDVGLSATGPRSSR